MTEERVNQIFNETGVLLEGHFLLTSGKHSNRYMQCAKLFQYPEYSRELCSVLAEKFKGERIDLVAGPAVGGIIIAYQVAACLGTRNIFAERQDGEMTFRRGFEVKKGENVLICEDVITTGGSVKEVIELVKRAGGSVAGVVSIVDRSGGNAEFGVPFHSVIKVGFDVYAPDDCPLCKAGSTAYKPGSRGMK